MNHNIQKITKEAVKVLLGVVLLIPILILVPKHGMPFGVWILLQVAETVTLFFQSPSIDSFLLWMFADLQVVSIVLVGITLSDEIMKRFWSDRL
jgi:hypothetical protein